MRANFNQKKGYSIVIKGHNDFRKDLYLKALMYINRYIKEIYPEKFKNKTSMFETTFQFLENENNEVIIFTCARNKKHYQIEITYFKD